MCIHFTLLPRNKFSESFAVLLIKQIVKIVLIHSHQSVYFKCDKIDPGRIPHTQGPLHSNLAFGALITFDLDQDLALDDELVFLAHVPRAEELLVVLAVEQGRFVSIQGSCRQ